MGEGWRAQGLQGYLMQEAGGAVAELKAQISAKEALLRHGDFSPDVVPRMVPPAPRKYAFASAQSENSLETIPLLCLVASPLHININSEQQQHCVCTSPSHLPSTHTDRQQQTDIMHPQNKRIKGWEINKGNN